MRADDPAASRPTAVRHLVLAALLVITAVNYLQRNAIGVAKKDVQADLRLSEDRGEHGLAVALRPLVAREHQRAAAVVHARRVARGV